MEVQETKESSETNVSYESEKLDESDALTETDKAEESGVPETDAEDDSKYLAIYRNWLDDFIAGNVAIDGGIDVVLYSDYKDDWYFALTDINDDGIKELLLSNRYENAANYEDDDRDLYLGNMGWYSFTIIEGSCQSLFNFDSVVSYVPEEKIVYSFLYIESISLEVSRVENGEVTKIAEYWYEECDDWYAKDGETCSEEEYLMARDECFDAVKQCPFDAIKLTSENMDERLISRSSE